jgi:hypothetical protein
MIDLFLTLFEVSLGMGFVVPEITNICLLFEVIFHALLKAMTGV